MDDNINSWLKNESDNLIIDNYNGDLLLEKELDLENNLDNNLCINVPNNILKSNHLFYTITGTNNVRKWKFKLNKSSNLNKFLKFNITLCIFGINRIDCSIGTLSLLAEKILNLKITENNKYFIIPILIFPNIININYKIDIKIYPDDEINNYNFKLQYNNTTEKIANKYVSLLIHTNRYFITDIIQEYPLHLNMQTVGIIIWFKSYDDNIEFLEPSILQTEFVFYKDTIKYSKNIDVEKINFNNNIGYFVSINKLNLNQLLNHCKPFNFKSNLNMFDYLIKWNIDYSNNCIKIEWSNFHNNSYCMIEELTLVY
jgi:hypothetical protein